MNRRTLLLLWCAVCPIACDRPTSAPAAPAPSESANASTVVSAPAPPTASASAVAAATVTASATAAAAPGAARTITFDADSVGGPAGSFEAVVGDWLVAEESGARGFEVDGSKWRNGTPSVSLAEQAKRLYGERYAEFLDGVKTFAFFPLAVLNQDVPAGDLRLSVRFYPLAGQVDQAAGIAFGIAPDGSYWGVRANALEDNLLYFKVVQGKRTVLDTVRSVPTPSRAWHTLAVELRGKALTAFVDGQKRFEKALDAVPQGRVGLWSKADSRVLFDDFRMERIAAP